LVEQQPHFAKLKRRNGLNQSFLERKYWWDGKAMLRVKNDATKPLGECFVINAAQV